MPADEYLRKFDEAMRRDRRAGFDKPSEQSVNEATAYALAAIAAAITTSKETETV